MKFTPSLIECRFLRRYKRFLADVETVDGRQITVHCPNPGAMLGLQPFRARAWISDSQNPKRKLQYTLEIIESDGTLVGINTNLANRLAREAIETGLLGMPENARILPEQKYGNNSRIDFLIEEPDKPSLYLEVKNVHFRRNRGLHEFPDSKTVRGTKHLYELVQQVRQGNRAKMLYIIQRMDGDKFTIASDLDRDYAEAFVKAHHGGVEMAAIKCHVEPHSITPVEQVAITLPNL